MDDALLGLVVVLLVLCDNLHEVLFVWLFVGFGILWLAAAETALLVEERKRKR